VGDFSLSILVGEFLVETGIFPKYIDRKFFLSNKKFFFKNIDENFF